MDADHQSVEEFKEGVIVKWQDTQIQFANYAEEKDKNFFSKDRNAILINARLNPGIMHQDNMD